MAVLPGPLRWRGESQLQRSAGAPPRSSLVPPSAPPGRPEDKRGGGREDGISQSGGSGFPATRQCLSVYGVKGEMEKAGRRRLASAAPPLGRLRRRESGTDEGGLGWRPHAHWCTRVGTTRRAPGSVSLSPASAAAGPRCPGALDSGGGGPLRAHRAVRGPRLQRSARQVTLRSRASGCLCDRSPPACPDGPHPEARAPGAEGRTPGLWEVGACPPPALLRFRGSRA